MIFFCYTQMLKKESYINRLIKYYFNSLMKLITFIWDFIYFLFIILRIYNLNECVKKYYFTFYWFINKTKCVPQIIQQYQVRNNLRG